MNKNKKLEARHGPLASLTLSNMDETAFASHWDDCSLRPQSIRIQLYCI